MTPAATHQELYPEHEKLQKVKRETQACGQFLDWAMANAIIKPGKNWRKYRGISDIIGCCFQISEQKLNDEKEAMLKSIREGK